MSDTPGILEVCDIAVQTLELSAASKLVKAADLMNEPHIQMRRFAEIDAHAAETIRALAVEIRRLIDVEAQAKILSDGLAVEFSLIANQVRALTAENDACWDALADLGDYLTEQQITDELGRRGIDMNRALERLRVAMNRAKAGAPP